MIVRTKKKPEIEYPSSDGKPMAETDQHRDRMISNIQRLQKFFAGRKVYVSGNLLIYYLEGDWRKCVTPDAFVVKNCKPGERETFLIWTERRRPNFALETTSKSTRREDSGKKKTIFAQIGIKDYFLYDPFGEWLKPPLQGFRLKDGVYQRIAPDDEGGVTSKQLGIRFLWQEDELAMFDAATGIPIRTPAEDEKRRADEEQRRADEMQLRAQAAEERAAALEQELDRTRRLTTTNGARTNGE